MNNSRWKEIWNKRIIDLDKLAETEEFSLYKELKRLDGFDVQVSNDEEYYKGFYNAILSVYESIVSHGNNSIYEVGCGSGANLLLFKNRGCKVGGIDYSEKLILAAEKVIAAEDICLGEAIDISTDRQYDVVLSDSVFAYFPNEEYAKEVLQKMYNKASKEIIILEIFDKELEEECNKFRRASVENYDELYIGLDKVFYSRNMFVEFARKNHCELEFGDVTNAQYWNSKYMYNVFLRKI